MPKLKTMSVNDYVKKVTLSYPSLYASESFDVAKAKVLNHLLFTIGNGISVKSFLENIKLNKINKKLLEKESSHLFDGQPLYWILVRDRYKHPNDKEFFEENFGKRSDVFTKQEVADWEVVKNKNFIVCELNRDGKPRGWSPYPYFEKQYNFIWKLQESGILQTLPQDYLDAFKEHCEIILKYSEEKGVAEYYPPFEHAKTPREKQEKLMEWKNIYLRETKDCVTDEEKMKCFSEKYRVQYTGDMEAFLNLRQKQTIEKYKTFLVETIAFLNTVKSVV